MEAAYAENFPEDGFAWDPHAGGGVGMRGAEGEYISSAAPVPGLITSARKIFIANMGADNFSQNAFKRLQDPARPYNAFYAEMKSWNHYEIVDSPADAELIFEIAFSAPIVGEGQSAVAYGPEFNLAILDAKTHIRLWTLAGPVDGAFRKATFEKNRSKGMSLLMEDLKKLSTPVAVRADARAQ
jgi:hypothetical protein